MSDLPDDELTWLYVERFLKLRKAKLIGPVWPAPGGIYWLAPVDSFDQWSQVGPISVPKLRDLIDELYFTQIESRESALALPKKLAQSARSIWLSERRSA